MREKDCMRWIRVAVVLIVSGGMLGAAPPVPAPPPAVAPETAAPAPEKDPLIVERDALLAEVREMDAKIREKHAAEQQLRQAMRAAIVGEKDMLEPAAVDEETGALIQRIEALEKELTDLKTQLKEKLKNHPDTIAREARMKTVSDQMQALRAQRTEIQEQKVKKVGRLRVLEQALAERRKAAAEAEAKARAEAAAKAEDGVATEGTTNE